MLSALIHKRTKSATKRKPKESNFLTGLLRSATQVQQPSPSASSFGSPEAFEVPHNHAKDAGTVSATRSEQDVTQVEQSQDQQYRRHTKEKGPELDSEHTDTSPTVPYTKPSKSKHKRDSSPQKLLIRLSDEPLSKWFPVDLLVRPDVPVRKNSKQKRISRQTGRSRPKQGSSASSKGKVISPVDNVQIFKMATEVDLTVLYVHQHSDLLLAF
jgi:hypothetical protein